jgi:hypothetical protein
MMSMSILNLQPHRRMVRSMVGASVSFAGEHFVLISFLNLAHEPWLEPGLGLSQPKALQKAQA